MGNNISNNDAEFIMQGVGFNYCPNCGSPHFVENDFKSMRCQDCGFVFYQNASAATAAFIVNDKRQLLVEHRKFDPQKGRIDLPGGFVDPGESIEEGIIREVKEETGLDVVSAQFLFSLPNNYLYSGLNIPTVDSLFLCQVEDFTKMHAGDDAGDLLWLDFQDINPDVFAFESTRKAMKIFIAKWSEYLKK